MADEAEEKQFHELPPITQEEVDVSQDQIMLFDASEPDPTKRMKRIVLSALKNALGVGAVVNPLGLVGSSIPATTVGGANGSITLTASGGVAPYEYRVGSNMAWSTPRVGSATFNGYSAGPYQGEVRDSKGTIIAANVTVGQPGVNAAPSANAGNDKTINLPTSSVQLTGSGSDSDGSIASYSWNQASGPNTATFSSKTVAQPTVSALVQGSYQFQLVVTDNQGKVSVADVVQVTVNAAPVAPPVQTFNRTLQMGVLEAADGVYLNAVPELIVRYNAKAPVADSAAPMINIQFNNVQIGQLDFNVAYAGDVIQFERNGVVYNKTFVNGVLNINSQW